MSTTDQQPYRHTYARADLRCAYEMYVDSAFSQRQIAEATDVPERTIARHATQEQWLEERELRASAAGPARRLAAFAALSPGTITLRAYRRSYDSRRLDSEYRAYVDGTSPAANATLASVAATDEWAIERRERHEASAMARVVTALDGALLNAARDGCRVVSVNDLATAAVDALTQLHACCGGGR